jgi:type II secretory pathway component GspD/PulD (secretin)
MTVRVDSRQRQATDWLRPFGTHVQNPVGDVPTVVFVFMAASKLPDRFLVAFSLAGEQRDQVQHAGTTELAKLLSSARLGVLSERGALEADARTNKLIARDIQPCLDALRGIVERLDGPVQ